MHPDEYSELDMDKLLNGLPAQDERRRQIKDAERLGRVHRVAHDALQARMEGNIDWLRELLEDVLKGAVAVIDAGQVARTARLVAEALEEGRL